MASITLWLQLGNDMKKLAKPSKTARIVQGKTGWYVLWYSENIRYRLKNGINVIKDLNQRLFFATRITDFINTALSNDKTVKDVDLPSYLFDFSKSIAKPTSFKFIKYFDLFIQRLENQKLSFYTVRKHITLRNSLKEYAQSLGKEDFDFLEIDKQWANCYKTWRFSDPRLHHINTVSKDFDTIRKVIKEAEVEDNIDVNKKYQSDAFYIKKIVSDEISLSLDEIKKIYELDLGKDTVGMNIVRDNFILACYTGIRWGNWAIKKENIVTIEGRKMIKLVTEKNYSTCLIPLHPIALDILKKYNFDLQTISDQKTNKYVKILGEMAGLTNVVLLKDSKAGKVVTTDNRKCDEISTHTARRTFVTIALVEWKVPPQYVMQITGHKTERQLYEYARIDKNFAALEMARIFDTFQ